jgi:hypothetical protein
VTALARSQAAITMLAMMAAIFMTDLKRMRPPESQ